VSRTFNSFTPTTVGVFGPGWSSGLEVNSAGSSWTGLADRGSTLALTDTDGSVVVWARAADGTYAATGDAAADGDTLTRAGTGTATQFTLRDLDGNATVFGYLGGTGSPSAGAPWTYRVTEVVQPGTNQTTSYTYNGDGTPAQLLAPVPAGGTCTSATWSPGCRALQFAYTPTAPKRVSAITLKVGAATGTVSTAVACYRYDTAGRLAQEWDPRVSATSTTACADPVLATTYGYAVTIGTPQGRLRGEVPAYGRSFSAQSPSEPNVPVSEHSALQ
jgi:hypothetical protein